MIWVARFLLSIACLLLACESRGSVGESKSSLEQPPPVVYGQLHEATGTVIPLSEIVSDPKRYEGQEVLTQGEVQRVCQKRGCWLELADSSGARAFVPMAGHAFTVPIESVGEQAMVEGTVHRRERSEAERKHLESDGAGSRIPEVSIEANAVLIR
jgi:hypothetical protein